jgi:CDP-2,3-bis-(O-geranylgeranyl)-sn-glycerol synthase
METTILMHILSYALPCWIINISLNFIYPLRRDVPFFQKFNFPFDFGKSFYDGRRIFGESQGFLSIPVIIITPLILHLFIAQSLSLLFLKSFCVFVGDLLGSFIKRRLGLPRGTFLPGVDHGDYMIITGLVCYLAGVETLEVVISALIITYIFHPIVCYIGYRLNIKREPL